MARRGLFCDGFSYPKEFYRSWKQVKAALDVHDLAVKFISPKASKGYHFVQLADDDHDLPELVVKLCGLFSSRKSHAMQLRRRLERGDPLEAVQQPHVGKIDLT